MTASDKVLQQVYQFLGGIAGYAQTHHIKVTYVLHKLIKRDSTESYIETIMEASNESDCYRPEIITRKWNPMPQSRFPHLFQNDTESDDKLG